VNPEDVAACIETANRYARSGDLTRAIEYYGKALRIDPNSFAAWNNLGNVFLQLNNPGGARTCYENAVQLRPWDGAAWYNLGRTLDLLGRHREALQHLLAACEFNPRHADAWTNLGNVHQNLGNFDEALRCFDRALPLAEHPAEVHVNRAMVLLNRGDFREGWREYEYRWDTNGFAAYKKLSFGAPRWKGESLAGKSILLYAEQGFGDAIQFARFIPAVTERAAEVFLEVGAPLRQLLEKLAPRGHILERGEALPRVDYHCSLMSLPLALNLEISSIPGEPYLAVPESARGAAREAIERETAGRPALKAGLCWRGKTTHRWNHVRSMTVDKLAPLGSVADVQWFLLQKDATEQEIAQLREGLHLSVLPQKHLEGFLATAAVIDALDLVLSIDTVTAHLTGALGKPLWLFLPAFYDWRWHAHLSSSPWYPTARLWRQKEPGSWEGAVESAAKQLEKAVSQKAARPS